MRTLAGAALALLTLASLFSPELARLVWGPEGLTLSILPLLLAAAPAIMNATKPVPAAPNNAEGIVTGSGNLNASGWTVATSGSRATADNSAGAGALDIKTLALIGGGLVLLVLAWRALR